MKINLLKISLSISLIGILLLLFLANTLQPKPINIQGINNKLLNQKVQVQGQITSIKTYHDSNFQVILIKDSTGKIDITINQIHNNKSNFKSDNKSKHDCNRKNNRIQRKPSNPSRKNNNYLKNHNNFLK